MLNVWRPAATSAEARPVLVWFHGGGFEIGSGHGRGAYAGDVFTPATDSVLVTVNYRLAALGFMAHADLTAEDSRGTSGNYGLEDQRAALEWVQRNIAAFGGDPNNVTIFGESAGGISVCAHMVAPDSAGLFHAAIIESGPCTIISTTMSEGYGNGDALEEALGCGGDDPLKCLREASPTDILTALPESSSLIFGDDTNWGPVVASAVLPETVSEAFDNGNVVDVPTIVGSNGDEGTLFVALGQLDGIDESEYGELIADFETSFGVTAGTVLDEYPASDFESPGAALATVLGEGFFNCPTRWMARKLDAAGTDAYLYHFVYDQIEVPSFPTMGAFHSAEIAFVFGTSVFGIVPLAAEERPLSEAMMGYWAAMAVDHAPGDGGGVAWPLYTTSTDEHLELDLDAISTGTALRTAKCDFWDSLL